VHELIYTFPPTAGAVLVPFINITLGVKQQALRALAHKIVEVSLGLSAIQLF
jgi:hypothetical protein